MSIVGTVTCGREMQSRVDAQNGCGDICRACRLAAGDGLRENDTHEISS